jgi:hypothetical protein
MELTGVILNTYELKTIQSMIGVINRDNRGYTEHI